MNIPFNVAAQTGAEQDYIGEAIQSGQLAGDGTFTRRCAAWFDAHFENRKNLLTPSCTHALEMAAFLIGIEPGDEVIMPSYTFVSSANPFVLRGAKVVFVDIRPDNLNIDETKITAAITGRTKAIVPVHYAGVACDMDTIMNIANAHNLFVIEDAAQGILGSFNNRKLGTIGHFGAISFHSTKNITSGGEGGLLLINDERFTQKAEVFREKGTDRSAFFRGEVDKYTWRDVGSSMLPSEIQAAYLLAQLEGVHDIHERRLKIWNHYFDAFTQTNIQHSQNFSHQGIEHNGHIFFVMASQGNRTLLEKLKADGIHATSHYEPLHTSVMGQRHSRSAGSMAFTGSLSRKIVRLPIYESLSIESAQYVVERTIYHYHNS